MTQALQQLQQAPKNCLSKGLTEYKVLELIGSGAQGSVYKVQNQRGEIFAMKKIICQSEKDLETVKEEIETVMALEHQNFVKYYDYFITSKYDNFTGNELNHVSIVMEYCNYTLDAFIQKMFNEKERLHPKILTKWFEQILNAFNYLHSLRIFHRDVKSSNILFEATSDVTGYDWTIKICDFGFTKHVLNSSGSIVGTFNYMAPEIQTRAYGFKADIFSIGVVFYQLATMKPIKKLGNLIFEIEKDADFVERSLKKLNVEHTLSHIIQSATNMLPEKRATADDLLKILHKSSVVLEYIKNDNTSPKIGIDHFGIIVEINQMAVSLLGFFNREEAIGYKIVSIFSKSTLIYYQTELSKILETTDDDEGLRIAKRRICQEPREMMIKRKHDGVEIPVCSTYYDVTCDKEKGNIRAIFFFKQIKTEDDFQMDFIDESLDRLHDKIDETTNKFSRSIDELFEKSNINLTSNLNEFLEVKAKYDDILSKSKTQQVQLCSSFFQMKQEETDYILEKFLVNEKLFNVFKHFLKPTIFAENALKFLKDVEIFKLFPEKKEGKRIFKRYLSKKATHFIPIEHKIQGKDIKEQLFDSDISSELFEDLRKEMFYFLHPHIEKFKATKEGGEIIKKILDTHQEIKSTISILERYSDNTSYSRKTSSGTTTDSISTGISSSSNLTTEDETTENSENTFTD
eukprot:gene12322-5996_t